MAETLEDWKPGSKNYIIRASLMVGLAGAYTIFVVATLVMFIVKSRDKRSGLDKRKVALVTIQAIGCYLVGADGAITGAANNWSCIGKLWLFNMGFALSLMALTARAFHLLVVSKVHMISTQLTARPPVVNIAREAEFTTTESIRTNDGISVLGGLHSASSASPLVEKGSVFSHMDSQSLDVRQKYLLPVAKSGKRQNPKPESRLRLTQQLARYKRLLPYVTERMLVLFVTGGVLAVALATLVINLTDKQFSRHNIVCVYQWGFIPGNVFVLGHFAIVYPIFLWRNWKAHDAYGIRNELIICETVGFLLMPPTSTRRANFNRMMDDPAEYQQFREFAASCFCSELTAFIDEYQALKARTLVLFERHTTRDSLAVAARHVSPPSTPSTLARGSDSIGTLRGRLRDDVLLQGTELLQIRTTSITVSILETVIDTYRGESIPGMRQFPPELLVKLEMINREFVDPRSYTSVNASPLTVKRFIERMQSKDYSLTLLDEFKSEVLFMLYTDVYTRYVRH
ncbi:hypothetical protein IWW39_003651 [Coemansia spiralis]|uniref:RGS domain-containing protein n=1 Tax=Coemansia spiralis TaxID=417178 RepID=A0A9W8GIV9_9FUNG|nr:hypothetical protein IWW39_003651 [Coemansia spiralis]